MPDEKSPADELSTSRPPGARIIPGVLALLVAMAGAAFIAFFVYWYEVNFHRCRLMPQVAIFTLTPIVFFMLFVVLGGVLPLLARLSPLLAVGRQGRVMITAAWLLTGAFCFRGLIVPTLFAAADLNTPEVQRPQMRQVDFPTYLRQDLFLSAEAGKQNCFGLADGSHWIAPWRGSPLFKPDDFRGLPRLAVVLAAPRTPLERLVAERLLAAARERLPVYVAREARLAGELAAGLEDVSRGPIFYTPQRFAATPLADDVRERINRLLLTSFFPGDVSPPKTVAATRLRAADVRDSAAVAARLLNEAAPAMSYLRGRLTRTMRGQLRRGLENEAAGLAVQQALNALVAGPVLFDPARTGPVSAPEPLRREINRLLLHAAFADALAPDVSPTAPPAPADIRTPAALARTLAQATAGPAAYVHEAMPSSARRGVAAFVAADVELRDDLVATFNDLVRSPPEGPLLAGDELLAGSVLPQAARRLVNRQLLEDACPGGLYANIAPVSLPFRAVDIIDLPRLAAALTDAKTPLSAWLLAQGETGPPAPGIVPTTVALAHARPPQPPDAEKLRATLVADLNRVLDGPIIYAPSRFAGVAIAPDTALLMNRMILGGAFTGEIAPLPPVAPWTVWVRPLLFWAPFILVAIALSMSLVRLMHRQWAQHELLTFPLAEIAETVIARDRGRLFPDGFYSRVFWIGFACTAFIYILNGLHSYFPLVVQVPIEWEQREMLRQFPFLQRYCGTEAYSLFRGWAWPFMIGIAVLLPTEVSFTSWAGYVLMILGGGFYFLVTGDAIGSADQGSFHVGAFIAMLLIILYLGRREYGAILLRAFTALPSRGDPLRAATWACRIFLASFASLTALLIYAGLDWLLALFLTASFSMIVILAARLTAEIGFPWLANMSGIAATIVTRLLGATVLGPHGLAIIAVIGGTLYFDASNNVAAQQTTFDKLLEGDRPGRRRRGWVYAGLIVTLLFAVGFSIFLTVWNQYSFGGYLDSSTRSSATGRWNGAAGEIRQLQLEGSAAKLDRLAGFDKLNEFQFERRFWWFFGLGAAVIFGCALLRLRVAWWPFHPLPLLLVSTWCLSRLYQSFFIGWFIKMALLRIGGGNVYRRSRPFFIGLIFGQVVTAGVWFCIDVIYNALTGQAPALFRYFA